MGDLLLLERDGPVAVVTLNRPAVLNALDHDLAESFRATMLDLEVDESVRCVVLRGAGRAFMAGGDVGGFHARLGDGIAQHVGGLIDCFHTGLRALTRMPKPTIASVHGACAGGGMSLAIAADFVVAADNAVFAMAYSAIATSPDGGSTWTLPRLIGRRKALELALLSDRIDAATAERLGLVNRVVPAADLEMETMTLARRLGAGPTRAYAATKRLIDRSFAQDLSSQLEAERESFAACATTRDFAEGVGAFVEKRKPRFDGA